MTEHDLAILYEWLKSISYRRVVGRRRSRRHLLTYRNSTCQAFCAEGVTPYIAMLNGEPIEYAQSYVALGSGDGWWEEETDPSTRNRPVTGECITAGRRHLGTKLVRALVELLFNDPEVARSKTDPSPSNLRAIRCYEKAGFEARYRNHPRWSSRVHGSNTPGIRADTRCCLTFHRGGRPRAGALGRPSCQTLNIMRR